jgi:hypothetical protein
MKHKAEYIAGYIKAASGRPLEKQSLIAPSWGGGDYHVGTGRGLGADLGYGYLLGAVPLPTASLRIGGDRGGVSAGIMGGLPMLGLDSGGVRPGWQRSYPRSIYKLVTDKLKARRIAGEIGMDPKLVDKLRQLGLDPATLGTIGAEEESEESAPADV